MSPGNYDFLTFHFLRIWGPSRIFLYKNRFTLYKVCVRTSAQSGDSEICAEPDQDEQFYYRKRKPKTLVVAFARAVLWLEVHMDPSSIQADRTWSSTATGSESSQRELWCPLHLFERANDDFALVD